MTKIIFISIIFSFFLQAESISWYGTYDKALEASHRQNKDMMILIVSSEQKESMSVLKQLFTNKEYINYLNKNYISVLINVEYKSSYPIELFYTTSFPSLFFASYKDESFLTDPVYSLSREEEVIYILDELKTISKN